MFTIFQVIRTVSFLIVFALIGFLIQFLFSKYKDNKCITRLKFPKTTYFILIIWTLFGFFTLLDSTQSSGCVVSDGFIFSTKNILYSATALLLITIGFFLPNKKIGTLLHFFELGIWLYKLFTIKGGYSVGFGGVPSEEVVIFDFFALLLRLFLIKQKIGLQGKIWLVLIITFIIIALKIQYFSGYFPEIDIK